MEPLSQEPFQRAAVAQAALTAALTGLLLIAAWPAPAQQAAEPQLFSQSAQAVLERDFPSPDLSYLLLDASGKVLAERWATQQAVSPGSLVKPFLALAYGEQHGGRFPTVRCRGSRDRCWLPRGHGNLVLEEAIAQSCNAYFLELAAGLDRHARRRPSPAMDSQGPPRMPPPITWQA